MVGTLRALTTIFLLSSVAVAQQYVISTHAGVTVPPAPAADGSIGAPMGVATDAVGNVYFVSASLDSAPSAPKIRFPTPATASME